MKRRLSEEEFYERYMALKKKYQKSNETEDLVALIDFTDKQVEAEKERYVTRQTAVSTLRKLEELESVTTLPPLQLYRKAVLFCPLRRRSEALTLFVSLLNSESTPQYIKERCCGYMLIYFQNDLNEKRSKELIKTLQQTNDRFALGLLERVMFSGVYEESWFEDEAEDMWQPDETILVFDCEERDERPLTSKLHETTWRYLHSPNDYDLFLDLIQEKGFIRGDLVDLDNEDMKVLFVMMVQGQACEIDDLYKAGFGDTFDQSDRQRNKFAKYYSRLRSRLESTGLDFPKGKYYFSPQTSYCAIFKESWKRDLLRDLK